MNDDELIGRLKRVLLFATLLSAATAVQAYGGLILIDERPADQDRFALGPAALAFPDHPGASRYTVWPIVGIDYYSTRGGFVSTDNGIGWNFFGRADLQAGVRLWPQLGRDDSPEGLPGLPGVPDRLGKGLFLNFAPLDALLLQSSLMYGAGRDGDGLMAEIGATSGLPPGNATLAVTFGGSWANRAYRQSVYGVGAAADSPITMSHTQGTLSMTLWCRFR